MTVRFLAAIIILAVLLFGSVEVWSSALIISATVILGLVWTLRKECQSIENYRETAVAVLFGMIFLCYGVLQILPLPAVLVKIIAPGSYAIRDYYSVGEPVFSRISLDPYKGSHVLARLSAAFAAFAIMAYAPQSRIREMAKILVVFGFCISVLAIVQKATWNGGIYWFRELTAGGNPFGPFVNRNHFAGLIGMLFPLGLAVSLTTRRTELKALFLFMSVICAVAIVLSLSRGGIVSLLIGVALFSLLMALRKGKRRKVWLIAIFVVLLATYLVWLGMDPVIERFYKTDVTKEERLQVWTGTWAAIRDFWFSGSGLGTFINIYPIYAQSGIKAIFDHAHNDYLELILETGMIGCLLVIGSITAIVSGFLKKGLAGRDGVLRIGALVSVGIMAVHSIFDFNLHILSNLLVFAAVLGIAASAKAENMSAPEAHRE